MTTLENMLELLLTYAVKEQINATLVLFLIFIILIFWVSIKSWKEIKIQEIRAKNKKNH